MRVNVLLLVLAIGVLGVPRLGHAEKVRSNQNAKVYNRPGEQGKVIVKVKEGQAMTVIAKEGRWLKVRVSGRTGYVPRSKVDMPDDDEIARNTRRRSFVDGRGTKRGFGASDTAPDDRIGADATEGKDDDGDDEPKKPRKRGGDDDEDPIGASGGDDEDDEPADSDDDEEDPADDRIRATVSKTAQTFDDPDTDSDKQFKVKPSETLFVIEKQGKWTLVENDEGDAAYIQTSKLDIRAGSDDGDEGGGPRGRIIDLRGRLGVTLVSQTLTSAGGVAVWPDRYAVGSSAFAVALGGAVLYPYKNRFLVGGELAYDIARAVPGVAFDQDGPAGPMAKQTTGFTIHNFNLRVVGGYDLKRKSGAVVFARLGYHYESFLVDNVTNLTRNSAKLPSEVLQGAMVGAALALPRITDKIGLRVSIDAMLGASLRQTKNLEDGANPKASKLTLGTGVTYRWKPAMDIQITYDLNYASVSFGAPVANSQRMHTGTSVQRTDLNHTVAAGVAKAF